MGNVDDLDRQDLSRIKREYRTKLRDIQKYDGFIDEHQAFCVFFPATLAAMAYLLQVNFQQQENNTLALILQLIWITLLATAIIALIICGVRTTKKEKLTRQIGSLRHEAMELSGGNSQLSSNLLAYDNKPSRSHGVGIVAAIVVFVAILAFVGWNNKLDAEQQSKERATQVIQQEKAADRRHEDYLQQQRQVHEQQPQASQKDTSCISTAVGTSVYTNCY